MAKNSPEELEDSSWQKVEASKVFQRLVQYKPRAEVFCRRLPGCRTLIFDRWKERREPTFPEHPVHARHSARQFYTNDLD